MGSNGLEPSTSRLSGVCSNQLSYEPLDTVLNGCGGGKRVRTADPLLAGQVLYQLSYTPITVLHYRSPKTYAELTVINKTNAPYTNVRSTTYIKNE